MSRNMMMGRIHSTKIRVLQGNSNHGDWVPASDVLPQADMNGWAILIELPYLADRRFNSNNE